MVIFFTKAMDLGGHKIRGSEETSLNDLKKLNIFVGKNNSGKSRFLRHLIQNRDKLFTASNLDVYKQAAFLHHELSNAFPTVKDDEGFFIHELGEAINEGSVNFFKNLLELKTRLDEVVYRGRYTVRGNASSRDIAQRILDFIDSAPLASEAKGRSEIIFGYIPILRGLRPLVRDTKSADEKYISKDCYSDRTIFDYFKKDSQKGVEIFSGLDLYQQIQDMLLSSVRTERDFVREFENFLSTHFFNGKEVILVSAKGLDVIRVSIDGDERSVYDLGDGIQSIICNVFLAYKNKDKDLVLFIEEPEIYLHPGMQRTLIEVFLKELKNVQVFLTTHSNHFLDLIYDYEDEVSIFSFEKKKGDFLISNITSNREIIDVLGIRNSSVYLSNCVIWVEGVTDRMYIKKLLDLYFEESKFKYPKEDYHFTLAEYGGGNIKNFDFVNSEDSSNEVSVDSISSHNLIIADNDGVKTSAVPSEKKTRLENLKSLLGDGFVDDYVEVENLFPFKVHQSVVTSLLGVSEKKLIGLKEIKADTEVKFNENLLTQKIGFLLKENLIEVKEGQDPKYFKKNSIECLGEPKKAIADMVIEAIDELGMSFSDFPEHTQDVIKKIASFIEKKNTFE